MHHQPEGRSLAEPAMQETPTQYPTQNQPHLYQSEPQQYPLMGSLTPAIRPNSPEMPTILETNSQNPSPEGPAMLHSSPISNHLTHPLQQGQWNPTNSWLPPAGPQQGTPASLTGHYPMDRLSSSKQAQLHTAPSATGGNQRSSHNASQSLPYQPREGRPPRGGLGSDPYARRTYVEEGLRNAYSGGLGPETPSPQEQRTMSRTGYDDSPQVRCVAAQQCYCITLLVGMQACTVYAPSPGSCAIVFLLHVLCCAPPLSPLRGVTATVKLYVLAADEQRSQ